MKKITTILSGLLLALMFSVNALAQSAEKVDPTYIKGVIEGKNFAFTPSYVIPLTGSSQPLTGGVGLIYNGTTLSVILPYVGQSYNASPSSISNSSIQFTSTTVEYKVTEKKNGKMEIVLRPKNITPTGTNDPTQLTMSVAPDGTAGLRIISQNRQPISYTGQILRAKL